MIDQFKIYRPRRILAVALAVAAIVLSADAQVVVDKTVAVVSEGTRSELITYSDLLWQLAMQPGSAIEQPRSDELNQAMQSLIDQRLFTLEAERLPSAPPSEKEVNDEIARILSFFPSTAAFESRLRQVGFSSIKDDAFQRLISQRLATKKYTDFRFRSFVVVTADEISKYYRDVYTPDFRRRYPGRLLPTLDEKRSEIQETITEQKVADRIQSFLDEAKRRATIEILIDV